MTTAPTEDQFLTVESAATPRLSQLHAAYPEAKSRADAAAAELKAITDGIKLELQTLAPEEQKLALNGPDGPALTLVYSETWRFDSTRFKKEHAEEYVRYAKKSGSWTLKAVKGGAPG